MRRIVSFFALVVMTMPCMSQQLNYSVSGTYADEGKKVYLIDNLKGHAIDSMVIANGKFSFSGSAAKDALMAVRVEDLKWTTDFFNDGTPVVINVNDSTLTGSALALGQSPAIKVEGGLVQGVSSASSEVTVFRGIPYVGPSTPQNFGICSTLSTAAGAP